MESAPKEKSRRAEYRPRCSARRLFSLLACRRADPSGGDPRRWRV